MSEFTLSAVHMAKEAHAEGGLRYVTVRCGAKLSPEPSGRRASEWTVWESEVTCKECKL